VTQLDLQYVAALARELDDDDLLHVGASQEDVWLAAKLARALWAPNLRVIAGCSYMLGAATVGPVPRTYARDLIAARSATFSQSHVFDDLRRPRVSFAGGLQVDERGNANLIGIYDEDDRPLLRGPGSGGLPVLTAHTPKFFIAVADHSPRVLVERVSRISVLGDARARARVGLPADALRAVITPLARFRPGADGLEVDELADGVSLDELAERTGFPVRTAASVASRPPLRETEIELLHQFSPPTVRSEQDAR
jgi:glutaconate CoA-transferase subunit B